MTSIGDRERSECKRPQLLEREPKPHGNGISHKAWQKKKTLDKKRKKKKHFCFARLMAIGLGIYGVNSANPSQSLA